MLPAELLLKSIYLLDKTKWAGVISHPNLLSISIYLMNTTFNIELTLPVRLSRFLRSVNSEMTLFTMYGVVMGIQIVPIIHQNVFHPEFVTLLAICFIFICSSNAHSRSLFGRKLNGKFFCVFANLSLFVCIFLNQSVNSGTMYINFIEIND